MLRKKIINYINKNCKESIKGKTYVITGANSGLGYELTRQLLYLNANVIMACRNLNKANSAKNQLLEEFNNSNIKILELDLASKKSIENFVEEIKKEEKIDGFINNAGVFKIPNQKTEDGFELVMGTNFLGTYMLNMLLMDYFKSLKNEVKIVFMSSLSYHFGKINYNDFFYEKKYRSFKVYSTSKLCLHQFFVYLKDKVANTNIKVFLTHPGVTYTQLIVKGFGKTFAKIAEFFMKIIFHKADQGVLGALYCLTNNLENGYSNGPKGLFKISGNPKKEKLRKKAYKDVDKLMKFSKELTNIG